MAKFDKERALDVIKNGTEEEQRHLIDDIAKRLETKRYGLVWEHGGEDKDSPFEPEYVVAQCAAGIPYPVYRDDLSTSPENGNGNMLLEGDNYVWLNILEQTYSNTCSVVYLDPPYNTGAENGEGGLKYNDNFVRKDDIFKHSMWLDFMYKRLNVAKRLMKNDGILFISCDDREQAALKLMADELFGVDNFIANIIWQKKTGASDATGIATITEYIMVYIKDVRTAESAFRQNDEAFDAKRYKYTDEYVEERGPHYYDALDRGSVHYSDSLNYGIEAPDGTMLYPNGRTTFENDGWTWKWSEEKVKWGQENGFIDIAPSTKKASGWTVRYKIYLKVNNENKPISKSSPFKNMITNILNANSAADMKDLFGSNVFKYSKPVELIKFLVSLHTNKDGIILDFFAGSGTTAHAVERLNEEDGGHRRWILITNNEDTEEDDGDPDTGICRDITKPRIDTVITGIRPDGKQYGDGVNSGYSYYQYDFLTRSGNKSKNERMFNRPSILDAMTAIKYGAHKVATDKDNKAYIYETLTSIIILMFGTPDDETLTAILEDITAKDDIIAIVPDGCPLDMTGYDKAEIKAFSSFVDNAYLRGRN